MQAGVEHLSWAGGTLRNVDLMLLVTEAQSKSMVTAGRAHEFAVQLGIASVAVVGNRLVDGDLDTLSAFAEARKLPLLATIPEDPAVQAADRVGACLLDHGASGPAATAIARLADALVEQ